MSFTDAAHDEPWNRFQTFPECIHKLYDMSTLFWRRSAELILRSWPLSWPTAWPSSTPWRLRPLEPCLVPAACQFWAAPQLQMRRFNTRRLGRFSGVSDSFTESQRVGGSSSWGHLCHCHCYVVYHNLSYFQICSSLYCLPGRIAHLWSSMCIAWFCHRHDRTWEIAKQKKTWFVLMCGVVWCQGLCESALAADGWERFDFPGSATRSGWSREWSDEVRRSRTRTSKSWQHRSWVGFVSTPLHLPPFLRYLHQGSRLYLGWGMLVVLKWIKSKSRARQVAAVQR